MANASTTIITATMLDSVGRFISNVGVPAAIAFFILWQIGPRLDQMIVLQTQNNTELTILASTCSAPRVQQ
jgi:hypothetical protein